MADAIAVNVNTGDVLRGASTRSVTVLASGARTATVASADFVTDAVRGIHVIIDVTAVTSTPSTTFTLQGKDPASGQYYTLLASAALTGTGTTVLKVFPGATASANAAANDCLPAVWRVNCTHGNANSMTYSVAANLLA